jgi:hypothetical protein
MQKMKRKQGCHGDHICLHRLYSTSINTFILWVITISCPILIIITFSKFNLEYLSLNFTKEPQNSFNHWSLQKPHSVVLV